MDEAQQNTKCLQSCSKFLLWIIEYLWAHKKIDILLDVFDSSQWPEMDTQLLRLEDPWRLRVASAQVYFIMKSREMEQFDRVMNFLEATYRLLPGLVAPIKHMKIIFGLKTMVIMRLLREGRGKVDTVFKINQFFPRNLPQYQDQCSQKQMFLMRKSHLDFKVFAQALTMDNDKLEDYVKNQMEEQYGEHYAQKVEDRLLHYLHRLATLLPGDTCIDKILKKDSPVTEEEKLLVEVVTSDSRTITMTLKKLLHCRDASCHPERVSPSSGHENTGTENSQLTHSAQYESYISSSHKTLEAESPLAAFPKESDKAVQDVSRHSLSLFDNDSEVWRQKQTGEICDVVMRVEEEGELSPRSSELLQTSTSSPQFCSKHQRWVRSILQGCPDECSEELRAQANVSTSPVMFQSFSSSSSEDLTPSYLIPFNNDQQHPPSQTPTCLHDAQTQAPEQTAVKLSPGSPLSISNAARTEPKSSKVLLTPVVRLIDITTVGNVFSAVKRHQTSPNHNQLAAFKSTPQVRLHQSENDATGQVTTKYYLFDQSETVTSINPPNSKCKVQTAPVSRDASSPFEGPSQTQQCSELSRKITLVGTTNNLLASPVLERVSENLSAQTTFKKRSQLLSDEFNLSRASSQPASTSNSQSGNMNSLCTVNPNPTSDESSQQIVQQNSFKPRCRTQVSQPGTVSCFSVVPSTSNSHHLPVSPEAITFGGRRDVHRAQLRMSLSSQAVLMQSKLLQPSVSLVRLSMQECRRVTKRRSSAGHVEPAVHGSNCENSEDRRMEEEDDADSSFDVNYLYSSFSSSSEGDDSLHCDPNYKPNNRKQLLLEYEAARSMNYI